MNRSKKIRKDDIVMVLSGESRGKTGKVLGFKGDRVYIQGVNLRKKCVKPTRDQKGGIFEYEQPIHISNLKVCIASGEPVKLRVMVADSGERSLCYKTESGEAVYRVLNKK